ncbi:hypothetical protein, partial [Cellulomonas iranensis]|uniref:hypothetical protein n=1 Tax=Cellulomonas iranensis TaxID=76862 RepID=UPI001C4E8159
PPPGAIDGINPAISSHSASDNTASRDTRTVSQQPRRTLKRRALGRVDQVGLDPDQDRGRVIAVLWDRAVSPVRIAMPRHCLRRLKQRSTSLRARNTPHSSTLGKQFSIYLVFSIYSPAAGTTTAEWKSAKSTACSEPSGGAFRCQW